MFTQLNQYHVVLEVKPDFQHNPIDLRDLFIRIGARQRSGVVSGGTGTAVFGPIQLFDRRSHRAAPDRAIVQRAQRRLIASTGFPTAARCR